jgi:predicted dehydrogenase
MASAVNVGIIGANWGMVGHLPALRALPNVNVTAVCTSRRETALAAAERYAVPKPYGDYQDMVRDPDLDLIVVGSKPSNRFPMVMAALEAGKNVFNANPFAVNLEQAWRMVEAQQRVGRVGAIDAQFQWTPQIARAKELIDDGFVGDLHTVSCVCHFPLLVDGAARWPLVASPPGYPSGDAGYAWLADRNSGASALRNLGGHCLHALVSLLGPVEELAAEQSIREPLWTLPDGSQVRPDTYDSALVTLRFKNGGAGCLDVSWAAPAARGFALHIHGSNGRISLTSPGGFPGAENTRLTGASFANSKGPSLVEGPLETPERCFQPRHSPGCSHIPRSASTMVRLFDEVADAIRVGREAAPSFLQALHVQEIVEAADRSAEDHGWQAVRRPRPF